MTRSVTRFGFTGLLGLVLAACAQITLVPPGKVTVANTLQVEPTISWSRKAEGEREVWTIDGPGLDQMLFVTGIANDEPILESDSDKKMPVYKSGMTPIEISEAIQAALVTGGITDFAIQNLRPHKLGGAEGFRFEFSYTAKGGLEKLGVAVGAVRKKKLNVIFFMAPRIHYFGKYKPEVERILASAKFI